MLRKGKVPVRRGLAQLAAEAWGPGHAALAVLVPDGSTACGDLKAAQEALPQQLQASNGATWWWGPAAAAAAGLGADEAPGASEYTHIMRRWSWFDVSVPCPALLSAGA